MKVVHDWLKDYIGDSIPSAEKLEELLTFHSFEIEGIEEVEGHTVIDVDVLPNRSSDCLCHRGIAREIASVTGTPLVHDPLATTPELQATDTISVDIEDETACPRFTAALIKDIEVKESPEWLQKRLKALGQRPINNIVDATNYVMYAIGQPIHAYDADLFPQKDGVWQFGVRFAREGETIELIAEGGKDDERTIELQGTELLIVDRSSDTPAGLAGVKGGRYAGVHAGTKNIIIEAAHFDPTITRKTARRLGIVIDASKRFENEPSRELPLYAQRDVATLIADIADGRFDGVLDRYPQKQETRSVSVVPEHANALLGLSLDAAQMEAILTNIGCAVTRENDALIAVPPWERTDLTIEEDFVEEIGRIHGYEHVGSVVPEAAPLHELSAQHYYSERVRHILADLGYSEVITSSFRKKDTIRLLNALASDKQYLRSSLRKNITESLELNIPNADLLGLDDIRIFEIGTVFYKNESGSGVSEHVSVALGVRTKQTGFVPKDDEKVQVAIEALQDALGVSIDAHVEKGVAEFNLTTCIAQLPAPDAYEHRSVSEEIQFAPYSPYPFITRDIALWVDARTEPKVVEQIITDAAGDLCVRSRLFDTFEKDGRISYAFRLVFQSHERTLTDGDIEPLMAAVYSAVSAKDWEVR